MGGHRHPTLAIVMLPGGQSHAFQGIAIARSMRGRGWRTAMVLPDFDHDNLEGKKLLGGGLETVVFKTPPYTNKRFQVSRKQRGGAWLLASPHNPMGLSLSLSSLTLQEEMLKQEELMELKTNLHEVGCVALEPLLYIYLPRQLCSQAVSCCVQFVAMHARHFEQMCRHLLDDGAAMDALRGLDADMLLLDVLFSCGEAIAGSVGLQHTGHRTGTMFKSQPIVDAPPSPPGCAELLQTRVMLLDPVDIVDPFMSKLDRFPYSLAVHAAMGSGLVHPMVRTTYALEARGGADPLSFLHYSATIFMHLTNPRMQSWLERATNALVSPVIFSLAQSVARASAQRIALDYNLSGAAHPQGLFRGSRILLVNAADGVSVPRSLPSNVKASVERCGRGVVGLHVLLAQNQTTGEHLPQRLRWFIFVMHHACLPLDGCSSWGLCWVAEKPSRCQPTYPPFWREQDQGGWCMSGDGKRLLGTLS